MRNLFSFFLMVLSITVFSQNKSDTIRLIQTTAKMYDLDFTEAEADSMIGSLNGYYDNYKSLHKTLPSNDIPFPFAFEPSKEKPSSKKEKIFWDIPIRTELPADRNELAFYSLPQLA